MPKSPQRTENPARPLPREALFAAERHATRDIAAYLADVSAELQEMAEEARLPLLAQFLAMARLEAEMQARLCSAKD